MLRSLALACPNAYKVKYVDIDSCFFLANGADWWFQVFCKPTEWSNSDEYLNEDGYRVTFRRVQRNSTVELTQRGAKLSVPNGKAAHFELVRELSQAFRPITVLDFLYPENADFLAARANNPPTSPFTVRSGLVSRVQPAGALVGTTGANLYYAGGYSFEWKEEKIR